MTTKPTPLAPVFDNLPGVLTAQPSWVMWSYAIKDWKWTKVPRQPGGSYASSTNSATWHTFSSVRAAYQRGGFDGVGIVLTGQPLENGLYLVGLDFDGVDFDNFGLPFATYMELSPSGEGVRAFCWAPAAYLSGFKDTTDLEWAGCSHVEVYFDGTPRHLTVTGRPINEAPIARLKTLAPLRLDFFFAKADVGAPELEVGTAVNLTRFDRSPERHHLIEGTGQLDRSAIMHGLIIEMIDAGVPQADVLATIVKTPALWQYCLDHRQIQILRNEFGKESFYSNAFCLF